MTASEQISSGLDSLNRNSHNHDKMGLEDAQTLIRVLCHKKDREASKFLKRQYQLPASSGDFSAPFICLHDILILYQTMMHDLQIMFFLNKYVWSSNSYRSINVNMYKQDGNCSAVTAVVLECAAPLRTENEGKKKWGRVVLDGGLGLYPFRNLRRSSIGAFYVSPLQSLSWRW